MEDRHIHTAYCLHGSKDSIEEYIHTAIKKGIHRISFTEHAPLPENFDEPTPAKNGSMNRHEVEAYINEVQKMKQQYKNDINISCGFEVDYIEGYEKETKLFLDTYGSYIEDSILSVHFLKSTTNEYYPIDFSTEYFGKLVEAFGSLENVYDHYIRTLQLSVLAELGIFKPKRIGHITLVKKYQKKFPVTFTYAEKYNDLLLAIKAKQYELDYNSAGLRKPDCLEVYPTHPVLQKALDLGIPLIFGSDAHQACDVGTNFDILKELKFHV